MAKTLAKFTIEEDGFSAIMRTCPPLFWRNSHRIGYDRINTIRIKTTSGRTITDPQSLTIRVGFKDFEGNGHIVDISSPETFEDYGKLEEAYKRAVDAVRSVYFGNVFAGKALGKGNLYKTAPRVDSH
jgi:hypothetical protein